MSYVVTAEAFAKHQVARFDVVRFAGRRIVSAALTRDQRLVQLLLETSDPRGAVGRIEVPLWSTLEATSTP